MNKMNKPWTDEELRQLEDPEEWDWDSAVVVHPTGKPGAAVLVSFDHDEFSEINAGAERLNEKLTEFVKRAALDRARQSTGLRPEEPAGRPKPGSRKRKAKG